MENCSNSTCLGQKQLLHVLQLELSIRVYVLLA